jgi:hypothetical protein
MEKEKLKGLNMKKIKFTPEQEKFILSIIDQWCLVWRGKIKESNGHSKSALIRACEQLKQHLLSESAF